MTQHSWFKILEVARKLSPDDDHTFTAQELSDTVAFEPTDVSTAAQIATAWLSKFVKWKYAAVVGKIERKSGRPINSYCLTEQGRTCEEKRGCETFLRELLAAVRGFQKAKGSKGEAAAFARLLQIAQDAEMRT